MHKAKKKCKNKKKLFVKQPNDLNKMESNNKEKQQQKHYCKKLNK